MTGHMTWRSQRQHHCILWGLLTGRPSTRPHVSWRVPVAREDAQGGADTEDKRAEERKAAGGRSRVSEVPVALEAVDVGRVVLRATSCWTPAGI